VWGEDSFSRLDANLRRVRALAGTSVFDGSAQPRDPCDFPSWKGDEDCARCSKRFTVCADPEEAVGS
jgi:hypothetical protein